MMMLARFFREPAYDDSDELCARQNFAKSEAAMPDSRPRLEPSALGAYWDTGSPHTSIYRADEQLSGSAR